MRKLIAIVISLMPAIAIAQYVGTASFIGSSNKSISVEFKSSSAKSDIVYGGGVSYFYEKGNVGRDYTNFIFDLSSAYQSVIGRDGAIYFLVGNKISNNLACVFRFGMGTSKRYYNGRGIPGYPDELWFVRTKNSEDILCGLAFEYSVGFICLNVGWDSFNSFGVGIGAKFNYK